MSCSPYRVPIARLAAAQAAVEALEREENQRSGKRVKRKKAGTDNKIQKTGVQKENTNEKILIKNDCCEKNSREKKVSGEIDHS